MTKKPNPEREAKAEAKRVRRAALALMEPYGRGFRPKPANNQSPDAVSTVNIPFIAESAPRAR